MNAEVIKEEQMYRGQAHFTTSDTEVLAYEIISERLHSDNIEDAVMRAARKLKGGYACIVMSPRKLIGIRDPQGIKPLVIGKKENTFILASESAAVEAVGGKQAFHLHLFSTRTAILEEALSSLQNRNEKRPYI